MKKKKIIISEDKQISDADKKLFSSEGAIEIKSAEQLWELAMMASKRLEGFQKDVQRMTKEEAEFVRKKRVDEGLSWRAVAQACYDAFDNWDKSDWHPSSNQLMGMALCERAAEFFDENYREPPWD